MRISDWISDVCSSDLKELGVGKFEILVPSLSILAEPPVAVVDANAKKHGTEKLAQAYLQYLYTPAAQDAIARNFYRPRDPRSEEHTSELQSLMRISYAVFCLKKKTKNQ